MNTRTTTLAIGLLATLTSAGCIEEAWGQYPPDAHPPSHPTAPPAEVAHPTPPAAPTSGSTAAGVRSARFDELTVADPARTARVRAALERAATRAYDCLSAGRFGSTLDVAVRFELAAAPHARGLEIDTGHPVTVRCLTAEIGREVFPTGAEATRVTARFHVVMAPPAGHR